MTENYTATRKSITSPQDIKTPPHSIEAEQAVLGGVMLENSAWEKVQECLTEDDFFRFDHRLIFRAIKYLADDDKPFDVITIAETLKSMKELDNAGGEIYLFELAKNTPSVANIDAYTDIVAERGLLRRLIKATTEIADSAFHPNGRPAEELLDEAEAKIFRIGEKNIRGVGPEDIKTAMGRAFERVQRLAETGGGITGLATGYTDLDKKTSGFQPADLIVIAGRPSMGKTAFAMNIAEHAAMSTKQSVLVFSMEMPTESLGLRLLSSLGRVDQHKIRTGDLNDEDWDRIASAVGQISPAALFIDDSPALSPTEVRTRTRRIAKEHGNLGLIVIDYLQLMRVQGHTENRVTEISEISRSLKALAKELNVPIIALSQLNRSLEQRTDKRPIMSDLRESGAIEQDADIILFIYRDEVYHENSADRGIAEIIIAKQRNGPIGKIKLTFINHLTRFENYMPNAF